jgi:hypothetical protein
LFLVIGISQNHKNFTKLQQQFQAAIIVSLSLDKTWIPRQFPQP